MGSSAGRAERQVTWERRRHRISQGSFPIEGTHRHKAVENLVEAESGRKPRHTQTGQHRSPAGLAGG